MQPRRVTWVKNTQNNDWFDFLRLNLDAPYFAGKRGIYVIWYTSPSVAKVVRLGQGDIADRLKEHRSNPEIMKFSSVGQLKVSWIIVDNIVISNNDLNGIEQFLAKTYSPSVGIYPTNYIDIPVTLIGQ